MSDPAAAAPQRANRVRTLTCPNCGGAVNLRAAGASITAVCDSCHGLLDVANPDVRLIAEAEARTVHPTIPLGTRGHLAGADWDVVGFQIRENLAEGWSWNEYLLFNPYLGFRFLAEDEEGWTLYCMLLEDVGNPEEGFEGRRYALNSSGTAHTTYVMGEFYWRVRQGSEVATADYTASSLRGPEYVLSSERSPGEVVWSRGVRVPAAEIHTAFRIPEPVAQPRTPAQPADPKRARSGVLWVSAASLLALFLLHVVTFGTARSVVVYSHAFHVTSAELFQPLTSEPFTVPGKGGNLMISAIAKVDNNWVELNCALVSADNTVYNVNESIEYYHGFDSDGAWSEGSRATSQTLASVPGGTYRLMIQPQAGVFQGKTVPGGGYAASTSAWRPATDKTDNTAIEFSVAVQRHVPSTMNFVLALIALLPYPIYRWWRGRGAGATQPHVPDRSHPR